MELTIGEIYRLLIELAIVFGSSAITWIFARRKNEEEVKAMKLDNTGQLIELYREAVEDTKSQMESMKIEISALREEIGGLKTHIEKVEEENRILKIKLKND